MRVTAVSVGLILWSVLLRADDRSVSFDSHADFSTFKTFTMHEAKITSSRPELSNPLFVKQIGDAVRAELIAKGLKETTDRPDIVVDCSIAGVDYSIGPAGRANVVAPGRANSPVGFQPVSFTEGTLVIDLAQREPGNLVWHGVYRRPRDNASKLAQKLPGDVKKLLSDYPPKKKK